VRARVDILTPLPQPEPEPEPNPNPNPNRTRTRTLTSGVPAEEIESIVRAAGPTKHGNIHYVRLVRALYPNSGGDVDDAFRDQASTRVSAVSERTSQILAETQRRASEVKERQLRASEAAELQVRVRVGPA